MDGQIEPRPCDEAPEAKGGDQDRQKLGIGVKIGCPYPQTYKGGHGHSMATNFDDKVENEGGGSEPNEAKKKEI